MKTVVLGASPNSERISYQAVQRLIYHKHEVIALGIKTGKIGEVIINLEREVITGVDTVTLYVGPQNQPGWYDYILKLKPRRIIFNPGTENPEFNKLAKENNIETVEACTLVMLSLGEY